jgi:predicted kinase
MTAGPRDPPDAVILCGVQGGGKTSFYVERFLHTHVRISLDLLRTHHREARLLSLCLETRMPFVVDKVNAERAQRARYVGAARAAGFRVAGFWVDAPAEVAIERNAGRPATQQVPVRGILRARKLLRLEPPSPEEGFDELWRVRAEGGSFAVEPLQSGASAAQLGP